MHLAGASWWRSRHGLVHVFWDLDNKPGDGLPVPELVSRVRAAAERFGLVSGSTALLHSLYATRCITLAGCLFSCWALQVAEMTAYANAATLAWVPLLERQRRSDLKARCGLLAGGSCPGSAL